VLAWLAGAVVLHAGVAGAAWEPVQRPAPPGALIGPYNETELDPSLAVSPAGEQLLAWSGGTTLDVASRPFGGAWGEPVRVATAPYLLTWPNTRFDPVDGAVLTWTDVGLGSPDLRRSSTRRPDGTWSDPVDVMQIPHRVGYTFTGPGGHSAYIWEEGSSSLMVMTRPPGGSWSDPETLTSDGGEIDTPSIVFDARGDAMAVWDDLDDHSEYSFRPSGGDWSAPARLFADSGHRWNWVSPSVAMDPAGDVLAVRADDGLLRASYRPFGGDFGDAHVLTTQNAGALVPPKVAVDGTGRATIVWRQASPDGAGGRMWTADRLPGGTFTSPEPLTPSTADALNPELSVLGDGTRFVLSELSPERLVVYVRPPGGSFDAGTTLAADGAQRPVLSENAVAWTRIYPSLGCSEIETTSWVSGDPGPLPPARPHCNVADGTSTESGAPPGANASSPLARDSTAPRLAVSLRRHQRALTTKRLKLAASSNESCTLLVTAKLGGHRAKVLGRSRSSLRRGRRTALRLRLHGVAFQHLRVAAATRRVKLTLTAIDASGNRRSIARTVVLAR
jgi:hypothetical protein